MTTIYLDHCATTPPLPAVVDAVRAALEGTYGNPSSLHEEGQRARRVVDHARTIIASLLSCRETEVIFTSGATESMNAALRGAIQAAPRDRWHFVTTTVEHEATIELGHYLAAMGVAVTRVGVDSGGRLDLDAWKKAVARPTAIASLMLVNNETGVRFDVESAAAAAKSAGALVHVDAVQAVGKIPLSVDALGVDFLSLSGHKFHAPKGTGVLYVRRGSPWKPLLVGAGHEGGRRAGTENVPGIAGLAVAGAHMAQGIAARSARLGSLSDYLERKLLALPRTRSNGDRESRVPGVVNVSFEGIEGSAVVLTLAREGICVSAGSACSAAQYGGSHVLEAMGTPFEYLHGAVRFSCSEFTTEAELDRTVEAVGRALRYLRAMDPRASG